MCSMCRQLFKPLDAGSHVLMTIARSSSKVEPLLVCGKSLDLQAASNNAFDINPF